MGEGMTEELFDRYSNKYNAKTETQFKFALRIEKDLGLICNFDFYYITRGRGWSLSNGSASASIGLSHDENPCYGYLILYHPLREYLVKKRYISSWEEYATSIHIEIENRKDLGGERRLCTKFGK